MEDQLEKLCAQLHEQNQDNPDTVDKDTRHNALLSIESSIKILKEHQIRKIRKRCCRTGMISLFRSTFFFHVFILIYFGLTLHLTTYVCTSLVAQKYTQFDFISTPSLMKGVACVKLLYTTIDRNKGLIDGIFQFQNGTMNIQNAWITLHHNMQNISHEWIQGKRNISTTWLYKDLTILKEYIEWIVHCLWYPFTHSVSDSTRIFILWLNNKTNIIMTLREAFMELPVIKHVREVVKSVEHTVDHHIIQPIRQKFTQAIHSVTNRFLYFSNILIQWGKPTKILENSNNLYINAQNMSSK